MPRYYFDIHEGKHEAIDEEGLDCADIEAAQREAFHALGRHRENGSFGQRQLVF